MKKKFVDTLPLENKVKIKDEEIWCLYLTVINFMLPRLIKFREYHKDFPAGSSEEKWNEILDEIIWMSEEIVKNEGTCGIEDVERFKEAYKLFCEYFLDLWC